MSRAPSHAPESVPALRPPATAPGMRVGLLGGTFDPPHDGHRQISLTALKRLQLDRVWWLVSPGNPLKSPNAHAAFERRLGLARAFAGHPRIDVTGFEATRPDAFTVNTLAFLKRRFPGTRFVWLMGADNLADFHLWRDWRQILRLVPVAVFDRPGYRLPAQASRAAHAFARCRRHERAAAHLADLRPPAWALLSMRLSALSSTALREAGGRNAAGATARGDAAAGY